MSCLLIDFNVVKEHKLTKLISSLKGIPNNTHVGTVLRLNKEIIKNLESIPKGDKRVKFINTDNFIQAIKGYMFFVFKDYNKEQAVCELNDLHGDITIKQIVKSLLENIPKKVTIWSSSELDSEMIKELTQEFPHKYLCTSSPTGKVFKNKRVCFAKQNDMPKQRELVDQIPILSNNPCKIKLKLSKDCIKYVKDISKREVHIEDGYMFQKEMSGKFKIITVENNINELDIDHGSCLTGTKEGTPIVKGLYTFHTHPRDAYKNHGVKFGWPSAGDYMGFLTSVYAFKTIVHLVFSLEGVWVISLAKESIPIKIHTTLKRFEKVMMSLKIKGDAKHTIEWYLDKINNFKCDKIPVFELEFIPWEQADNKIFEVTYKQCDSNCFTLDATKEYSKTLHQ
jgi:hypothetical protein